MKFKPGDLVEVEKDHMRFEMVDGNWVPSSKKIFGTVVGNWLTPLRNELEGIQPRQMYSVLIDGKTEVKGEHLLTPVEES